VANFGQLTAEIGLPVWGTPANFNGFRVLPLLLHRRRSPEANQSLHDVWKSPAMARYIYIFGGSCPLAEFCPVQSSLYVLVLRSLLLACSVTARHSMQRASANFAAWYKEWNYGTFAEAPPIFGWAAITLGIGSHSSFALSRIKSQKSHDVLMSS